jgi:hypothetical protein
MLKNTSMQKTSYVLIATLIALAGCGASNANEKPDPVSSDVITSSLPPKQYVKDEDQYVPKWQDENHTNTMLRNLVFDYIKAVRASDFEAIRDDYLTEEGLKKTIAGCNNNDVLAALKSCIVFPEGTVLVENIETIDDTHAKITFSILHEDGELINPAFELPATLTLEGPKLEFGLFENE